MRSVLDPYKFPRLVSRSDRPWSKTVIGSQRTRQSLLGRPWDQKQALHRFSLCRSYQGPVLFAASTDDQPFADDARALYAASGSAERQLEVMPGVRHGLQLLEDSGFRARVTAFIAAH